MGYTTHFDGSITVDPPLNESEIGFLRDLNQTRRMVRSKGPLFVGGESYASPTMGRDEDVFDHNKADGEQPSSYREHSETELAHYDPEGQPGLWCKWEPIQAGSEIAWDGAEKFYDAGEWMKYIVTKLLSGESAREYVTAHIEEDSRLSDFTFDHVCNGEIHAQGEDPSDLWSIVVKDSKVMVAEGMVTYKNPVEI